MHRGLRTSLQYLSTSVTSEFTRSLVQGEVTGRKETHESDRRNHSSSQHETRSLYS